MLVALPRELQAILLGALEVLPVVQAPVLAVRLDVLLMQHGQDGAREAARLVDVRVSEEDVAGSQTIQR